MIFKLGIGDYLSILTAELLGRVTLFGYLVVWDSPSIGVRVNLLQNSSRIGIYDETVGF